MTPNLRFYVEPRALQETLLFFLLAFFPGFSAQLRKLTNAEFEQQKCRLCNELSLFRIISIVELEVCKVSQKITWSSLYCIKTQLYQGQYPQADQTLFLNNFSRRDSTEPLDGQFQCLEMLSWNADQQNLLSISCHKSS